MKCRHHPTCPGCPLLDLPYEEQLRRKRWRIKTAFERYPHLNLPVPAKVLAAPRTEGYRHRLKLPLHVLKDHVAMGLYNPQTGKVLNTPDCPVLEPGLRESLHPMLKWIQGKQGIHSVDLRRSAATGELQLVLACQDGHLPGGKRAAAQLLQAMPSLASLAVSTADPEGKRVKGDTPKVFAGKEHIEEAIGDTRYRLLPGAFFQVDPIQAQQIHSLIQGHTKGVKRVLDLYSGVGAYARMLARQGIEVVAVEEDPQAVHAARIAAPPGLKMILGRAEEVEIRGEFDAVILNPARRGADPRLLARLPALAPRLIYVSCGPETLARDLDTLAYHGLRAAQIAALDLFPNTEEVETVVQLEAGPKVHEWAIPGGKACGPWEDGMSGALGRPNSLMVLVIGRTQAEGRLPGGSYTRLRSLANHSLLRITLQGEVAPALATLAQQGHPLAGHDPKTNRFFAEKAWLNRPFLHVEQAGSATAPLHGDLETAIACLKTVS